jgi:hypothetical protein
VPQLSARGGVVKSGGNAGAFPLEEMLTLLEALAIVALIAISLAGFTAAVAFTFALWFGPRG